MRMVQPKSRIWWRVTRPTPPSYKGVYQRPGGEGRPYARLAREAAEALDIVAARGSVPRARFRIHDSTAGAEPRPHERRPALYGGGDPGACLDRPRVLPQPAVEIADIRRGH